MDRKTVTVLDVSLPFVYVGVGHEANKVLGGLCVEACTINLSLQSMDDGS